MLEELADANDAELDWLGARARGRWKGKPLGTLYYWADIASVRGNEHRTQFSELDNGFTEAGTSREIEVRGWALDTGITLRPRAFRDLSFTAGYAVGSGDDQTESTRDHSFRQSGLNSNKGKFRGVVRFRYYGELLRPELSNLHISTLAVGKRFLSASSVDLVYHNYRQVKAAPRLRSARIEAPLNGENRSIGEGIDVVVGLEEWRRWEVKFIGSLFVAGDAYGAASGERAYRADFLLKYTF